MRIAIFSDIHGNLNALRAVLNDIKSKQIDDIYFLGDLCTLGPNPIEVAELLLNSKVKSILLFHGSPKSNTDIVLAETNIDILIKYFSNYSNSIFIGGHTHIQMQKRFFNKSIINPGSIGQPFQANIDKGPPSLLPYAEYLVLTVNYENIIYEFHQIKYDLNDYVSQIKSSNLPLKGWLLGQYS